MISRARLRFLLACFFILQFYGVRSQSAQGDFLIFGPGYSYEIVKDASLSALSYSGHMGLLEIGYYSQNEKWISDLEIFAFGPYQHPVTDNEDNLSRTTTIGARAHYKLAYNVYTANRWQFFAGISSKNLWDYRLHNRYGNSSENFVGIFGIAPALIAQRPFELWGLHFFAQAELDVPVASYVFRPGYIKPLLGEEISVREWNSISETTSVFSKLKLGWILDNGNLINLSYRWEYALVNPRNKMQLGAHHLSITTAFKF